MNFALVFVSMILSETFPVEIALGIMMCVFTMSEIVMSMVEIFYIDKASVALLGQRAPPNDRE